MRALRPDGPRGTFEPGSPYRGMPWHNPPRFRRPTPAGFIPRGKKLGGFRGRAGTAEDTAKARKAHTAKAASHAASLAPIIARLDPDGSLSLRALAARLTADGLPTPAGAAVWTAAAIARVKARRAA